jgi:Concanavalin A-like lectin/glucanases superfamily/Domain of unknown function (DUF2341)
MAEQAASEQRFSSSRYGEGAQTVFSWIVIVCFAARCSSTGEPGSPGLSAETGGGGATNGGASSGSGATVDANAAADGAAQSGPYDGEQSDQHDATQTDGHDAAPGAWSDASFTRRRRVTLDPGLSRIEGSAFTDFPVALIIAPGTIDAVSVRADGGDVRFVDGAGHVLARDLEAWDPNGASVVWVALPNVPAVSGPIYMYYGSPAAAAIPTDREAVWKAPYSAVWHFSGKADDATSNHYDGTGNATFAAGKLGLAAQFSAAQRSHIAIGQGTSLARGVEAVTLSAWVKTANIAPTGWGVVLGIGIKAPTGDTSRAVVDIWGKNSVYTRGAQPPPLYDAIYAEINPDEVGGGWEFAHSPINTVPAGVWHYVTAVFDAKSKAVTIYVDGVQVGGPVVIPGAVGPAGPGTWTSTTFSTSPPGQVQIGAEEDLSHAFYDGLIDELRIESVARSSQWIAAQAIAVSGGALALGAEERSK